MKRRSVLGSVLAAVSVFSSTSASAQFGGGGMGGGFPGGGGMGGGMGRRSGRGGQDRPGDSRPNAPLETPRVNQLEVTLNEFHEDLKLKQEQEQAWQAYADSVRALSSDATRQATPRLSDAQPVTLLQRIDRLVDTARNRLTALEDVSDRAKALYQSLSADQRGAADPRLANLIQIAAGGGNAAGGPPAGSPDRGRPRS